MDSDYTEIISKPSIRKPLQRDNEVIISATDDQDFLSKLQIQLNKAASPSVKQVKFILRLFKLCLYLNLKKKGGNSVKYPYNSNNFAKNTAT